MENNGTQRHPSIESLTPQHYQNNAEAAISLWEQLATQIIAIIGVEGFDALYARSVFLTQSKFPWLDSTSTFPTVSHRFANLKTSLEETTPELAHAANHLLMSTFIDILVSLIGGRLTIRILDTAWADGGFYNSVSKDSKDE